jgi:polyisoprenoid-binding protein YceI
MLLRKIKSWAGSARWIALWCLPVVAATSFAQTPGTYVIDSEASEIHWRIYKAGAFARFGHNHVIAIAQPSGTVEVTPQLASSSVSIDFDVGDLIIDDPQLRARYGEDFASEPSAEDIAGTRTNMLTEQVLNGAVFPRISLTGAQLSGLGADQTMQLSIALLGADISLNVPVNVSFDGTELRAQAQFRLLHQDLGMEPFSVMMGALQVAPEIDFTVDIRAALRGASETATAL